MNNSFYEWMAKSAATVAALLALIFMITICAMIAISSFEQIRGMDAKLSSIEKSIEQQHGKDVFNLLTENQEKK